MTLVERLAHLALWIGCTSYWMRRARGAEPSTRREALPSRLLHVVPLTLTCALLWLPDVPLPGLERRFVPAAAATAWTGIAVQASGVAVMVWARRHLGRHWSGFVAIQRGHALVDSGPYAFVRHPIYAGLLLAFAGSALAVGEWRGVLAWAVAAAALWRKIRHEERSLEQHFGDAYAQYRRDVAMLVPGVGVGVTARARRRQRASASAAGASPRHRR